MVRTPTHAAVLLAALAVAAGAVASAADRPAPVRSGKGGAATYKWVDDQDVVHYGDRVPAEYAKRERAVLNRQGVEVGRVEAERTPEQIAELERRDKLAREQKQHDEFLLTTYTSVRDIEGLRDQRLQQLADQRASMDNYVDSLVDRLTQLQLRAQVFRPYNASTSAVQMPDKLAEDLIRTVNEVRRQRQTLDERRDEETALRARFQSDIDRYKLLRSSTTAAR